MFHVFHLFSSSCWVVLLGFLIPFGWCCCFSVCFWWCCLPKNSLFNERKRKTEKEKKQQKKRRKKEKEKEKEKEDQWKKKYKQREREREKKRKNKGLQKSLRIWHAGTFIIQKHVKF